jgi:hypothetical protein
MRGRVAVLALVGMMLLIAIPMISSPARAASYSDGFEGDISSRWTLFDGSHAYQDTSCYHSGTASLHSGCFAAAGWYSKHVLDDDIGFPLTLTIWFNVTYSDASTCMELFHGLNAEDLPTGPNVDIMASSGLWITAGPSYIQVQGIGWNHWYEVTVTASNTSYFDLSVDGVAMGTYAGQARSDESWHTLYLGSAHNPSFNICMDDLAISGADIIRPLPTFTTSPPTTCALGGYYYYEPNCSEPVTFALVTKPSWASISDGSVYGTPWTPGVFAFTLSALGTNGTSYQYWNVTVGWAPIFISSPLTSILVGHGWTYLSVCNESVIYTLGTHPTGATLSSDTVSWLPSGTGTFFFILNATSEDGGETAHQYWNVTVSMAFVGWAPTFTSSPYTSALVGQEWSYSPICNESVSYYLASKPDWATLSGDTITGTPTAGGTDDFVLEATSVNGTLTANQEWSVTVIPPVTPGMNGLLFLAVIIMGMFLILAPAVIAIIWREGDGNRAIFFAIIWILVFFVEIGILPTLQGA